MKRIIALLLALAVTLPLCMADELPQEAPPAAVTETQVQEESAPPPAEAPGEAPAESAGGTAEEGPSDPPADAPEVPEVTPEAVPEDTPEDTPEDALEDVPEGAPAEAPGDGPAGEPIGDEPEAEPAAAEDGNGAEQESAEGEEEELPGSEEEEPAQTEGAWGALRWRFADGVLTVTGNGAGQDAAPGGAPWYALRDGIARAVVKSGVTRIGANAFYGCGELTEISIAASVASIGEGAFSGCGKLRRVLYGGAGEDWDAIAVGGGNAALAQASLSCAEQESPEEAEEPAAPALAAPDGAGQEAPGQEIPEQEVSAQDGGELEAEESLSAGEMILGATVDEDSGKVLLSWSFAWDGAQYTVYRATTASGKYGKIAVTEGLSYRDTYPGVGKAFWYKVEAANVSGGSAFSAPVRGKAVCAKPSVAAQADPDTGKYTLKWGKVTDAARYEVTRAEGNAAPVRIALLNSRTTSLRDAGASAGKTYTYSVRALASSSANDGAWSDGVTVRVKCAVPALKAGNDGPTGKPVLAWKAVEGAAAYEIIRGGAVVCVTEELSWRDEDCRSGDRFTYGVRVLAQDREYDSDPAYRDAVCACAAPVTAVGNDPDTGRVRVTWEAQEGARAYEVWRAVTARAAYRKVAVTQELSWTERAAVGKTYWYKVRCLGEAEGSDSAFGSAVWETGACAMPDIRISADAATGKYTVKWNKVLSASKYEVWRCEEGGEPVRLARLAGTKRSYTDLSAAVGGNYSYGVKAIGSREAYDSAAAWSECVPVKCGTPALSVKNDAASGLPCLSWKAVEGAAGYEIARNGAVVCETGETSWRDENCAPGDAFTYSVRALAPEHAYDGPSAQKGAVCACAAPVTAAGNDPDTGRAVLTWDAVPGAVSYEIYRAGSTRASFRKIAETQDTSWMEKAAVGTTYWYKVRCLGPGSGADSASGNTVSRSGACAKPAVTAKNNASTGKNVLSWNKVTGASSYEIWRAEGDGALAKVSSVRSTVTGYTDASSEAGVTYRYAVRAVGSKSAYSGALSDEVSRLCVCAAPSVSAGNDGVTGAVLIRWKEVAGAASYEVERDTGSGFAVLCTVNAPEYADPDVPVGTAYRYRVRAIGLVAGTDSSVSGSVEGLCVCAAPEGTAEVVPSTGKPRLTWQEVPGGQKYEVYRSTADGSSWKKIATVTGLSYNDGGAAAGTAYRYRLRTIHRTSKLSSGYSETYDCLCVCASPSVTAENEPNSGKVSLSWKAVQGAEYYEVTRLAGGGADAYAANVDGTAWTDTEMSTGCTGTYRVRAIGVSAEYDSAASTDVSRQCLPARPMLTGTLMGELPYLMWSVCDEAALYRVYTCETENGQYVKIGETDETAFLYADAPVGREMYYRVSCVTESGCESAMSTAGMLKAFPDRTYYRKGTTSTEMPEGYGSVQIGAPVTSAQTIEYIIFIAQSQLGKQYSYTPVAPRNFDCATLVYYCFRKAGITIPGSAIGQGSVDYGEKITKISDLQRGDIVSFNTNEKDGDPYDHSGIYLGGGWFLHASSGAGYVVTSTLTSGYYKEHFTLGRRVF